MQWDLILAVVAVLVVLEGCLAFFNPDGMRKIMMHIGSMPTAQIRQIGLIAITIGAVLLLFLR